MSALMMQAVFLMFGGGFVFFVANEAWLSATTDRPQVNISNAQFEVKLDASAIVSLKRAQDSFHTDTIAPGHRLGDVVVRYRKPGGEWHQLQTATLARAVPVP